jgi:hypothetical protein
MKQIFLLGLVLPLLLVLRFLKYQINNRYGMIYID